MNKPNISYKDQDYESQLFYDYTNYARIEKYLMFRYIINKLYYDVQRISYKNFIYICYLFPYSGRRVQN
jgi:hypothetical protein